MGRGQGHLVLVGMCTTGRHLAVQPRGAPVDPDIPGAMSTCPHNGRVDTVDTHLVTRPPPAPRPPPPQLLHREGFTAIPSPGLPDVWSMITAVELRSRDRMTAFCRGIQRTCPIGSYISPEPGAWGRAWAVGGWRLAVGGLLLRVGKRDRCARVGPGEGRRLSCSAHCLRMTARQYAALRRAATVALYCACWRDCTRAGSRSPTLPLMRVRCGAPLLPAPQASLRVTATR